MFSKIQNKFIKIFKTKELNFFSKEVFMKKIFKRMACLLAMVIVFGAGLTLAGCFNDDGETQIMNLSVNPSVEFILDKNDKVVTVSATNEDGAYILEKFTTFTGMSAKDAALKFLELSEEYGFVVSGSTTGETFKISISGGDEEKLYKDVKNKITNKATELGLTIGSLIEIDDDELEEMVAEYYQEYSKAMIDELEEKELINLIKQSREETKELLTDDEKQAYYRERAQKVINAKINAINNYLEENSSFLNNLITPIVNAMNNAYNSIQNSYTTINTQIEELYNNTTNGINLIREEYITQKKAYLLAVEEYKTALEESSPNLQEIKTNMENLKAQADATWSNLASARNTAKSQLSNLIETTIHTQLTALNTQIDALLSHISLNAIDIQNQVQTQINLLKTEFENATQNPWE